MFSDDFAMIFKFSFYDEQAFALWTIFFVLIVSRFKKPKPIFLSFFLIQTWGGIVPSPIDHRGGTWLCVTPAPPPTPLPFPAGVYGSVMGLCGHRSVGLLACGGLWRAVRPPDPLDCLLDRCAGVAVGWGYVWGMSTTRIFLILTNYAFFCFCSTTFSLGWKNPSMDFVPGSKL